ncbi:Triosephosphate isomerase (TpiA) (PDB:1HG3) [Commensalibacter communis]|uniref:triose-phosphate isomerase n=1 Tax=Commensalibacter communis TaxID=2972786 RepID=UPI0022FF5E0B|nr:triose-phosphate isomerase [Commensalibacter communis]CAI3922935.1 Triosephosphate isomerase (TpiA) (PDB:1HG3) [Commensalibacter communis]CAI3936277.1 Triosephosphate isomerase (TpiA) (PDB:1HG3) [Commensalibacter communis]
MAKPIIIGNWKMNGLSEEADHIVSALLTYAEQNHNFAPTVICPPFTQLYHIRKHVKNTPYVLGAQDCHIAEKGAYTGDISAAMLKDVGAEYVILGHSERRAEHKESNELVNKKAVAAYKSGLLPIVCIGETKEERDSNQYKDVIANQIKGSLPEHFNGLVAYEPVWAIGTGVSAKNEDIAEVILFIREKLVAQYGENGKKTPILYGGSVKPNNVKDIFAIPELGGVLVGGVSLIPEDFLQLVTIAQDFI